LTTSGKKKAPASASVDPAADGQRYLAEVMAEIDEEVRRRRASGDLPARVERELDELFLEFSPVAGRGSGLSEALRMVDAAAFIDPVVPVDSAKSGGAAVKRTLRSLSLWYVGYVTHQVSQFASAVSRSMHLLDEQVSTLRTQLDAQRVPPAEVIDVEWAHAPDAWWVKETVESLSGAPGRALHAAAGDGWLVRVLTEHGIDAYGVDPRGDRVRRADLELTDLRDEEVLVHLRSVEPAALGAIVLSGVVDGMTHGERQQLLEAAADRLSPEGLLVVHSLSAAAWAGAEAPPEADLSTGHPLRPRTWEHLLGRMGFAVRVAEGPAGGDYLVVAQLRDPVRPAR